MRIVLQKWHQLFMLDKIRAWIIKILFKGELEMMAMLFAQRVILGKTDFEAVPTKLKSQVADILINECGVPELVPVEYGGTKGVTE